MRQHAYEEKGGTLNHLSPFLINFYRQRNCLTAAELARFPPLSVDHPGKYVRDNEVDTDEEDSPASTPPTQRDEGRSTPAARVPRKRRWREEPEEEQHQKPTAPIRQRPLHEVCSRLKQKARMLVLPASSADTAMIAKEKRSASPETIGRARTSAGAVDHATPPADERRPSGQGTAGQGPPELPRAMRTSVPPTHRRLPADRRPLADVGLCLRVGRESSPTHRRPPTSRQDSPPVQRRKGKEPAEDPPSGQGPSGQDPPACNAPRFAPSAPGPSGHRVISRERAETAPSAGNPPEDAPSAVGPSGQGTSGGRPSALSPSAIDAFGAAPAADKAPEIAPTRRPDAALAQDRSREQDLTEEQIVRPRDEIQVRDAQLHFAQTHSA